MRIFYRIVFALIFCLLFNAESQAARRVIIEAQCEVVDVQDEHTLLGPRVKVGDKMTSRLTTFLTTRSPLPYPLFRPLASFAEIGNSNIQVVMEDQVLSYVIHPWVRELERTGNNCRSELNIQFSNNIWPGPNLELHWPKFNFTWTNNECYGDMEFERPKDITLNDWTLDEILVHNEIDFPHEKPWSFTTRVLNYRIAEYKGGRAVARFFHDLNGNCILDDNETTAAGVKFVLTDTGDQFSAADNGTAIFDLEVESPKIRLAADEDTWEFSCTDDTFSFNFADLAPEDFIDIPLKKNKQPSPSEDISLGADAARVGKALQYRIFVKNRSNAPADGTVRLNFDDILTFTDSRETPAARGADYVEWRFSDLPPGVRRIYSADFKLSDDKTLQGEELCAEAAMNNHSAGSEHRDQFCQIISGQLDPIQLSRLKQEHKQQEEAVQSGEEVDFIVRVRNDDSRPVQTLSIIVPQSDDFAPGSLRAGASGHDYEVLRLNNGDYEFVFNNIDLNGADWGKSGGETYLRFSLTVSDKFNADESIENHVIANFTYRVLNSDEFPNTAQLNSNSVKTLVASGATSLGEQQSAKHPTIAVYPNPADDAVYVRHSKLAGAEILAHDQLGRRVLRLEAEAQTAQLNTSGLQPGLYTLDIRFRNGERTGGVFSVMR